MGLKKFQDIKDQLKDLNRRDGYQLLLSTHEWEEFRNKILELDSHKCSQCDREEGVIEERIPDDEWQIVLENEKRGFEDYCKLLQELFDDPQIQLPIFQSIVCRERAIGEVVLQIHHKLYFWNKLPWEYRKGDVAALCQDCHRSIHKTTSIYTYSDETMKYRKEVVACSKCSGTGYLPEYSYRDKGICYDCGGVGLLNDGALDWQLTN